MNAVIERLINLFKQFFILIELIFLNDFLNARRGQTNFQDFPRCLDETRRDENINLLNENFFHKKIFFNERLSFFNKT